MAHWITSKLKVAENLLQQIDQQAAESLGKTEKKQYDDMDFDASPKPSGTVPLRDQLKKKTPATDGTLRKLSSDDTDMKSTSKLSSDCNNNNELQPRKEVARRDLNPRSSVLEDSDWTELLGTPKQQILPKTRRSDGALGEKTVKKVRGKVGNVGSNVKGNGKVVENRKGNGGVGVGKSDVEEQHKFQDSNGSQRVLTLEANDRSFEGLQSCQGIVKPSGAEGKKDVNSVKDITGKEKEALDLMKLVESEDQSLSKKPQVVSGSNGAMIMEVCNSPNEAVVDDENFRRATLVNRGINVHSANHAFEALKNGSYSESDLSGSDSVSTSASDSESEMEREREERVQRRRKILAAKAAAKAAEVIKEHENLVARLEGEKQSLEKIIEESTKQAAREAFELQSTMMEMMDAAELEKQKHNTTRMEVLALLAKLETANADFAKSLASVQWTLHLEVNRVMDLQQLVEGKEVVLEELRLRNTSAYQTKKSLTNFTLSKGNELEKDMLEAEHSLLTDKIAGLEEKATNLQVILDEAEKEVGKPTEVEVELRQRLCQMTDQLIQKQAQIEALASDKAMILFRIEAASRLLDENNSLISEGELSSNSTDGITLGSWNIFGSKLHPVFEEKIKSGKQHLGSLLRQLDTVFSAGAVLLARNPAAKFWLLVYLFFLHLWFLYIVFSHSHSAEEAVDSSSVVSLGKINGSNNV